MTKQTKPLTQCPNCGSQDFSGKGTITMGFTNKNGVLEAYEEEDQGITGNILCNNCEQEFRQEDFVRIITKDWDINT